MISSNKEMVQALVDSCLRAGVRNFVCSPGSRNSSIVIALDEHPDCNTYVIHGEREAPRLLRWEWPCKRENLLLACVLQVPQC